LRELRGIKANWIAPTLLAASKLPQFESGAPRPGDHHGDCQRCPAAEEILLVIDEL
jgi:hypothetical protein